METTRFDAAKLTLTLQFLAFGAALFGIKLWLIHTYGNETPYWDQWDSEAALLYEPYLRGELSWQQLFAPHNEHRIFTTRVLGLLLLRLNDLWSPLLEMVVNAGLHVLALGTTVWLLAKAIGKRSVPALLFFTLLVFGVPYAWENTLAGFQAQFYFVLLFSVLSIWLMITKPVFQRWWWLGVLSAIAAYFSLASGAFALAAVAVALLFRFGFVSRDWRELAAAIMLVCLFMVGVSGTPVLEHHAALKAANARQFVGALADVLAWPAKFSTTGVDAGSAAKRWPSTMEWLAAIARNLPLAAIALMVIWRRLPRTDPMWFIFALVVWLAGQAAAVAYGRSVDVLSSRYLDLHAMALLLNFAAILMVCMVTTGWRRIATGVSAICWLVFVLSALVYLIEKDIPSDLAAKRDASAKQEANLRAYLATGDGVAFGKVPFHQLPYPHADRLASIVNLPVVQNILPTHLQAPLPPSSIDQLGSNAFQSGGVFPGTADCRCGSWGSYSAAGDGAMGELLMRYDPPASWKKVRRLEIKVAGYPSKAGRIELIQGGVATKVRFGKDPREAWVTRHLSVKPEPFVIRVVDASPSGWIAVSQPVMAGRIDWLAKSLLAKWRYFVAVGAALACVLLWSALGIGKIGLGKCVEK